MLTVSWASSMFTWKTFSSWFLRLRLWLSYLKRWGNSRHIVFRKIFDFVEARDQQLPTLCEANRKSHRYEARDRFAVELAAANENSRTNSNKSQQNTSRDLGHRQSVLVNSVSSSEHLL